MTAGDRQKSGLGGDVRDGIRAGIGILAAMKDAIEETVQDLLETDRKAGGDGAPEGGGAGAAEAGPDPAAQASATEAADVMEAAKERARAAAKNAAERLNVASREELDALRVEVAELRARLDALEARERAERGE